MIPYKDFVASTAKKSRSCGPCAIAKRSCDHKQPCSRCVSLNITDKCIIFADKRRSTISTDNEEKFIVSSSLITNLTNSTTINKLPTTSSSLALNTTVQKPIKPTVSRKRDRPSDDLSIPIKVGPAHIDIENGSLLEVTPLTNVRNISLSPAYIYARFESLAKKNSSIFNLIPAIPYPNLLENTQTILSSGTEIPSSKRQNIANLPILISNNTNQQIINNNWNASQLTDPDTERIITQKALLSLAHLSLPAMRVSFKEPDWISLKTGNVLIIDRIVGNSSYCELLGAPIPAKGRLMCANGDQFLAPHVHYKYRDIYHQNFLRAILLRLPYFRQRINITAATGYLMVDEFCEFQYGPTGAVKSITITLGNPDFSTLKPYTVIKPIETELLSDIDDSSSLVDDEVYFMPDCECMVAFHEIDPSDQDNSVINNHNNTNNNQRNNYDKANEISSSPNIIMDDLFPRDLRIFDQCKSTLSLTPTNSVLDHSDNENLYSNSSTSSPSTRSNNSTKIQLFPRLSDNIDTEEFFDPFNNNI